MKKKILLALLTLVLLLSFVLSGCSSGVPQTQYAQATAQLADAQSQLSQAQSDLAALRTEKATVDADLKTAQAQVADLSEQVTDLFVCSDMAAEVWNLLKTQGINALMVIGDIHTMINDITLCSHAWVLAEVSPGQYLALETTGGVTVTRAENPLYYHGWTFTSPSDIKEYQQIVVKYNTGVTFHNWLVNEEGRILNLYNNSANQAEADQWLAVYNELVSLVNQKETDLNQLHAQLDALATVLN